MLSIFQVHALQYLCFSTVIIFFLFNFPSIVLIFSFGFSSFVQYVHSAFQTLLGHFRSRALQKFKNDLDRSVKAEKKGFAPSVRSCTEAAMLEFDTNLKGIGFSD